MSKERIDIPTIEDVKEMLLDPDICGAGEEEMPVGKILLFSAFVGEDDIALSSLTGLPIEEVFSISKTLIKNGVFGAGLDHYRDYFIDDHSAITLNCDIACGKNMLIRGCVDGEPTWKNTAEGKLEVERIIERKRQAKEAKP